jgi:flagellar basal-body rod protein FlgB
MQIETRLCDALGRYLDLAAREAKLTATNMANIDTPGYRTKGFDFEAEMHQALGTLEAQKTQPVRVQNVDGLVSRPDGNNVSMDREGLHMAEA